MDFIISTDLSVIPKQIDFNFEQLKADLSSSLVCYKNMTVSADGIRAAKSDKAKLNALKTAIEDKRKEIKRQCLAPYEKLEAQIKEIVYMIDEPINTIDKQVKAFDEIKKKEKYQDLHDYFAESVGDLSDYVVFEKILNPKWGNTTVKLDFLKTEISDRISKIRSDLDVLRKEYGKAPYKAAISDKFRETCYDLSKTLVYAQTLKYEHEKELRAETEIKARKTELDSIPPGFVINTEPIQFDAVPSSQVNPLKPETLKFEVDVTTKEQVLIIRNCLISNGIPFRLIRNKGE